MTASFGDDDRYGVAMGALNKFLTYRKGDAFSLLVFGDDSLVPHHSFTLTNSQIGSEVELLSGEHSNNQKNFYSMQKKVRELLFSYQMEKVTISTMVSTKKWLIV